LHGVLFLLDEVVLDLVIDTAPTIMITIAITHAKIGRPMKNCATADLLPAALLRGGGRPRTDIARAYRFVTGFKRIINCPGMVSGPGPDFPYLAKTARNGP